MAIAHRLRYGGGSVPPAVRTQTVDVAVVGAGLAGLTAAMYLQREGFETVVLESEHRAGGAAVSEPLAGAPVPLGTAYFVDQTQSVNDVLAFAAVEPVLTGDDVHVIGDAVLTDVWSDTQLRIAARSAAKADALRRFRDDVLSGVLGEPTYPLPEVLEPRYAALDAMTARELLAPYRSPLLEAMMDAYCRSSMGGTLDDGNAYCLLNFYASEFGSSFGGVRYTIRGGIAALTQAMARRLTTNLDACVVGVTQTSNGVTIDSMQSDGSVVRTQAKALVMAAPKFVAARLLRDLPNDQIEAMRSMQYAPYTTIHVVADQPLMPRRAFDTWHIPASSWYTDVVDLGAVDDAIAATHRYSIYAPVPVSNRVRLLDERAFAEHVGDVIRDMVTHVPNDNAASITQAYAWAWGHALVMPRPGSHNGIAQRARKPHGAIVFAGTDNEAAPAMEHAVESGATAARQVRDILRASSVAMSRL